MLNRSFGSLLLAFILIATSVATPTGTAFGQESCDFPIPLEVSPTAGPGAMLERNPTLLQLATRADVVLQARVRGWYSYQAGNEIKTDISFDVDRVVAGVWQPREATLTVTGGRVGNVQYGSGETPEFARGQLMLLFAQAPQVGSLRLIDGFQGALHVQGNCTVPAANGLSLSELRSRAQQASGGQLSPGANVTVEPRIEVHPAVQPSNAAVWKEFPVEYRTNPNDNKPASPSAASVDTAWQMGLAAWDAATTGFSSAYVGSTALTTHSWSDNTNFYAWDATYDEGSNVLATAFSAWWIDGSGNPTERFDVDIMFNNKKTWATDGVGNFDVATVAIHEAGHGVGFTHEETDTQSVMRSIYQGVRRNLSAIDASSMLSLYPNVGGPTATPTRTPTITNTVPPTNTATATRTPTATVPGQPSWTPSLTPTQTALPTSTATRTSTTTPSVTLTPAGPVLVQNVATDDGFGVAKTVFRRGDPIRYIGVVNNQAGQQVDVQTVWDAVGPGGSIEHVESPLTTPAGIQAWGLNRSIPAQAAFGTYTFTMRVTFNGQQSSQNVTFQVVDPSTATPTSTSTATRTSTPAPSATPTATGTITQAQASATPTLTSTLAPSATPTATATRTNTPITTSSPIPAASNTPTTNATSTPTRTVTVTPTSESTAIPTATQTASPTATPTQTATATTGTGTVGGRNFQIKSGSAVLNWEPGTLETGYLILRFSGVLGTVLLPSDGSFLSPGTSQFTDNPPTTDSAYCYMVLAFGGTPTSVDQMLGRSDLLCIMPHVANGAKVPPAFAAGLNQTNTARLSWGAQTGVDAYVLMALGSETPRVYTLSGSATSASDDTLGKPTCYILFAVTGGQVVGTANIVCVFPAMAFFTTGSANPLDGSTELIANGLGIPRDPIALRPEVLAAVARPED